MNLEYNIEGHAKGVMQAVNAIEKPMHFACMYGGEGIKKAYESIRDFVKTVAL